MPVSKHGHQHYADDPHRRVFRVIYPEFDDAELDQPPTDGNRQPYLKPDGTPHTWASFGTDPARASVVAKVAPGTAIKLHGTPHTARDEPVIYWVNAGALLATLTDAQAEHFDKWLAAHPEWSNNFVDLGAGDAGALTTSCVAPCWVVVIGGGAPAVGALQKSATYNGVTVALWVA